MTTCPACARAIPDEGASCPGCGALLLESAIPTIRQPAPPYLESDATPDTQEIIHQVQGALGVAVSTANEEGRFIAGTILASRYRIVSLLGRGGMGEVYKAEDLKLKQTVALKFLPEASALDGGALARFHNEVRIARQVAHPNVCRVYDIGEVEGLHFLSMEFIDGEDLSSLLRRIGRLPGDKAVEVARQMCAGLAVAHEQGVLHRDLKPANVMIDGRGKARITDFGLAVVSEELRGEEVMAGTPAYMAPEQLKGQEVTKQSDIYALGLVLYELFTGKRVYEAKSLNELIELHEKSTPATPSSYIKDIDPLAERVILRCLEKDPQARPATAMQVALALPGGDPLQAALALGETPSPEMVAASGEKTGLGPRAAVACLLAVVLGLFLAAWIIGKVSLIERVTLDPPELLARKARDISARLGYADRPTDSIRLFQYNTAYLKYVLTSDPSPTRWNRLQFPAMAFFYTESPQDIPVSSDTGGWWTPDTPPFSKIIDMQLDPQGRLLAFSAAPPLLNETAARKMDWSALFGEAGLDPTRFTATESQWTPPFAFDERAAWIGADPQSAVPLRIEAAAWRGKPTFFQIIYPWTPTEPAPNLMLLGLPVFGSIMLLIIIIGAGLVAWSNYRRRRSDQRGAFKLACVIFVLQWIMRILYVHHAPTLQGLLNTMIRELPLTLYFTAIVWVTYFAFEPFLRRYWPTSVITWSRVLAGRLRDALVGRDVLIGVLFGISFFIMKKVADYLVGYQDVFVGKGSSIDQASLNYNLFSIFFLHVQSAILTPVVIFFLLFLLRVLLRRQWLAVSAAIVLFTVANGAPAFGYRPIIAVPAFFLLSVCTVVFATRFGLVALFASMLALNVLSGFPLTLNLSAWYFGIGLIGPLTVLALAVYGFHTSLGGQKVFAGNLLDE
jgi:serine/threonine-protein kinase